MTMVAQFHMPCCGDPMRGLLIKRGEEGYDLQVERAEADRGFPLAPFNSRGTPIQSLNSTSAG